MIGSEKPLVSVIIPVHNCEKYIDMALASVVAQDYPAIDVVIVNDGCTDSTLEIINNYPISVRLFHQKKKGPASARNEGVKEARGEFITFLDGDDFWEKDHLITLIGCFNKDPDLMIAKALLQQFFERDNTIELLGNPKLLHFHLGSSLYRKEVFDLVGWFSEDLFLASDADWYLRSVGLKVKMQISNTLSLWYRKHDKNITNDIDTSIKARFAFLKKHIDRKKLL